LDILRFSGPSGPSLKEKDDYRMRLLLNSGFLCKYLVLIAINCHHSYQMMKLKLSILLPLWLRLIWGQSSESDTSTVGRHYLAVCMSVFVSVKMNSAYSRLKLCLTDLIYLKNSII
jgi:hypothetical protein